MFINFYTIVPIIYVLKTTQIMLIFRSRDDLQVRILYTLFSGVRDIFNLFIKTKCTLESLCFVHYSLIETLLAKTMSTGYDSRLGH